MKKLRRSVLSALIIAGLLLVLILANVLFGKINTRYTKFDLTPSQMFSISDQTRSILEGLDHDTGIYWIVEAGEENNTIQLLLERYQSISDRIRVEKIDPKVYPTIVEQYTSDYNNNSLVVYNEERSRYLDYFELYEYDYSDYYKDGTSVNVRFAGETLITSAINYVDKGVTFRMYTVGGHGETDLPESFAAAVRKENVEIEALSLAGLASIPEDASLILLNAPLSDLSKEELACIEAYLDGGGNLFYVSTPPKAGRFENLDALAARYGLRSSDGIVIEGYDRYFTIDLPYYLLPVMPVTHPVTAPLQKNSLQVVFPLAQGIRFIGEQPAGVTTVPLFITSEFSYSKVDSWYLQSYELEEGDIEGPFYLGTAVEEEHEDGSISRMVWISTGSLTNDSVNEMSSGANEELFLNSVDWLTGQDESVIAVRSKPLSEDHLRIDSRTATVLSILIIGVLPILYLAVGTVIRIRRKRR